MLNVINDRLEPYDEICSLVNVPDRHWKILRHLSVRYYMATGTFTLSARYGVNYSPDPSDRCNSTDEVFRRFATYGGYDLSDVVDEEHRALARLEIARANVPGHRSNWMTYRMLKDHEAVSLLYTLGFQHPQSGGLEWLVPDRLLQYVNPYVEGTPRLLKEQYATTAELRVALRSIPDLEYNPGKGRCRNRKRTLSPDVLIALRLWIAYAPQGPEACRYDANPEDELVKSPHRQVGLPST